MKRCCLFLFLCLAVPPAPVGAAALTYRGETTLWQDTVWSGEVLVDGILTVAPTVTLEIRPGTTVRFTPFDSNGDGIGEHELFIQGELHAVGSAEQQILFTSAAAQPAPGDWGALNMMGSEGENRLTHCRVEYAYRGFHAHFSRAVVADAEFRRNVRGLQFQESDVSLRRCRITDNLNGVQFRDSQVEIGDSVVAGNRWGIRGLYSRGRIERCRIENNLINGVNLRDAHFVVSGCLISDNRRGLYLQRGSTEVSGNRIVDNSEHGILLEQVEAQVRANAIIGNGRAGIRWIAAQGMLRDNDLSAAGAYALIDDGPTPVDARGNWWGVPAATLAALVRDGADRVGMGEVDVSAPLSAPPALPQPAVPEYVDVATLPNVK